MILHISGNCIRLQNDVMQQDPNEQFAVKSESVLGLW